MTGGTPQKVLVVGLARSGIAASRLLASWGHEVVAVDRRAAVKRSVTNGAGSVRWW